jgi:hypothetical protein
MDDPGQFFGRFAGEIGRVVPHLSGRADVVARQVYDLLRRHASQTWPVVGRAVADHAGLVAARRLPVHSLLRQVVAPEAGPGAPPAGVAAAGGGQTTPPASPPPAPGTGAEVAAGQTNPGPDHVFRPAGQCWLVALAGAEVQALLPSLGAAYLHELLANPGVSISSLDLACRIRHWATTPRLPTGGGMTDTQALNTYRGRYEELAAELALARERNDPGTVERCQQEMAELMAEITRVTGLGGRIRPERNPAEKARKAVGNAISRTLAKIGPFAPELARHLDQHTRGGMTREYSPPAGVTWRL